MKELFKKTATSIIISSIAAFIIGLIMVIAPNMSLQTIGLILGIYIIAHGIVLIGLTFTQSIFHVSFFGIASGLLSVVLGMILIAMPNIISTIFAIALGIWIVLSSVNIMSIAFAVKGRYSGWLLLLLLGLVDLAAGIIILFNPFASAISIVVLGGIIIMVHSAVCLIDMCIIKKNVKEITKALESSAK